VGLGAQVYRPANGINESLFALVNAAEVTKGARLDHLELADGVVGDAVDRFREGHLAVAFCGGALMLLSDWTGPLPVAAVRPLLSRGQSTSIMT
jgi:hypothetical protein